VKEKWQVIYYLSSSGENPVRDFLDKCLPSIKAKAFRILLNVSEYGLKTIIPHVKKLTGTPLWEIRIMGKENVRIFYVALAEKRILLLHAFYKKKKKTPKKEINIALKRLKDHNEFSS